jgi:sulfite reductase (ferredoxin)
MKHGWTADSMLEAIEAKLGYKFEAHPEGPEAGDLYRDHVGVNPQKNKQKDGQKDQGLNSVGITVINGRMNPEQMHTLADLAATYGSGELRTTIGQNMILVNVPSASIQQVVSSVNELGFQVEPTNFFRGAVACTGTEFCKLAITETKAFNKWLVSELEDRLPEFDQQFRLHVTGCTNSCGQGWIADIGLEGKKMKKDGVMVDAFYFMVGGSVGGEYAGIARQIGYRAAATDCPEAIERLLRGYLKGRTQDESLRAYFRRTSDEDLRAQLNGAAVAPVERDMTKLGVGSGVE